MDSKHRLLRWSVFTVFEQQVRQYKKEKEVTLEAHRDLGDILVHVVLNSPGMITMSA